MAGYFEVELALAFAPQNRGVTLRSIDGYKGTVYLNFSITGPGGPTVNQPAPFVFLDEEEEWHSSVTISGGTAGQNATLTVVANDDTDTDTDSVSVLLT